MISSTAQVDRSATRPRTTGQPVNQHYEMLLRSLERTGFDAESPKVVGLVSCESGAGVSTVASNLAIEAAQGGAEHVLLVDANLAHPKIHRLFSIPASPGLIQAVSGDLPIEECLHGTPDDLLHVLPAGKSRRDVSTSIRTPQIRELLDTLREEFDFIVVDLAPATDLSMSFPVASLLDGVLLVVEAERNQVDSLKRMKRQFINMNANLLGAVLNKYRH